MPREAQPRCPYCGKALYKSLESQRVKKEWPYKFCRNKTCVHYGDINHTPANKSDIRTLKKKKTIIVTSKKWPLSDMPPLLCSVCGRKKCICDREPIMVSNYRLQFKKILANIDDSVKRPLLLVISILLQELGDKSGDELIARHSLRKAYGVDMIDVSDNGFLDMCLSDSKAGKAFTGEQCARLCSLYGDEEMAAKYRKQKNNTPISYDVMADIVKAIKKS
jgi:hypothetical protein